MVDSVKGLREIDCHCHSPPWGTSLVETCYYLLDKRSFMASFSKQAASGKLNPQCLPPTEGAAKQHSLRAYLQLWDWQTLDCMHFDPIKYG